MRFLSFAAKTLCGPWTDFLDRSYLKRFAQSAGPGHVVLCLRKRLPKSEKYRAERSPIFWPLVFLPFRLSGALLKSLFALLGFFGVTFGVICSSWGHFGLIFSVKKRTGAPKVPQERPRALTPEINSPIWRPFGALFSYIFIVFC